LCREGGVVEWWSRTTTRHGHTQREREREQKTRRENGSDKSISRDQKKQGHPFELN